MGQYFVITIFLYFKDIKYFGLTTEQSSATFGVNCDVPNKFQKHSNCCLARMVCLKQMGLLLQTCHLEQSSRKINIRNLPVILELSFRTSNCTPHHKYRRLSNQGGRNTIIYFNLENPFYHPLPLSIWHFDHFRVNLTMTYKVCKA